LKIAGSFLTHASGFASIVVFVSMSNTEDPTIQPAASGQDASQHSSPLREPQPQTAPNFRKRPGRKPKSAKVPGEQDLRWTNEMIETLLKLRRVKYLSYFMSKSNPKAAGEGWSLVVKDRCQHHNRIEPLTKIRSKYDNLLKKWRDFGPGSGKQTKRTGNNQPEPNTLDDPLLALIAPFFAKSPGTGSDLGQSTDKPPALDDHDDDNGLLDETVDEILPESTPLKRSKTTNVSSDDASVGASMENAFAMVSDSVSNLARAVGEAGGTSTELRSFMQESRQNMASLKESLDNSKPHSDGHVGGFAKNL